MKINNGGIPLSLREPKGTLPVSIKAKRVLSATTGEKLTLEKQASSSVGIKSSLPEASITESSKRNLERSSAGTQSIEFENEIWLVLSKGSQTAPRWTFASLPTAHVISGRYDGLKLGQVQPDDESCLLEAEFSALPRHLQILEASNPFINLTFEKGKVFQLLVAKHWLGQYLSRAVLPLQTDKTK